MKITGIATYVLQGLLEDKAFGWSQRVTDRRQTALCMVSTDEDIQVLAKAFYYGGPGMTKEGRADMRHRGGGMLLCSAG